MSGPASHDTAPAEMTLAQALSWAQAMRLDRLDAQLLLLHALGRGEGERAWLLAHDTDRLPAELQARYEALCRRRLAGEPVAYLLGRKEFWGLELAVDARVLVPRPDTETLVAWALEVLDGAAPLAEAQAASSAQASPAAPDAAAGASPRVIDLGTGSGAIALALAHARPDLRVEAVDRSADALAVARANAQRLGLQVDLRQARWLEGAPTGIDLIVSNPPYIAERDPHLGALTHEPLIALVAGADGLDDLRTIVAEAPAHLVPGGWLLLEHGWDQAEAVRALLAQAGFAAVQSRQDLAGHARCSGGRWPGKTAGAAGSGPSRA